ncbi:MAG: hypothetical protein IT332_03110 [Ardenticatenales bacterium]|nr:hypothetical protein [Ardenticatenales bacterium]
MARSFVAAIVGITIAIEAAAAPWAIDRSAARAQGDPPGWTRVDTGPFSVALPPGWRYEPLEGTDSFVGLLVGDGLELQFDHGAYWLSPPQDATRHVVQHERIDFRSAVILRPREPQDIIGMFIEHADDFGAFDGRPTHLSIVGHVPLGEQDRITQIFQSVRFRRLIGDGGRWVEVAPPDGFVSLMDVDLLRGSAPWVVGVRYITTPGVTTVTLLPTVFRRTKSGWEDRALPGGEGGVAWAVAGDWAVTMQALYHFDEDDNRWQRERTPSENNLLMDVAVDRSFDASGWAIGIQGVIKLSGASSTEIDGGWGTAKGIGLDVLPRAPLAPVAGERTADAMAISGVGADLFDGRSWQPMPSLPSTFTGQSVDIVSGDEAWIVCGARDGGPLGTIHHRLGGAVTMAPETAPTTLWSVDLLSPAEGWAVGGGTNGDGPAELWRFRDGAWERQPSPCDCLLRAVQAMPNGEAWAVGFARDPLLSVPHGIVLHYVPGASAATPDARATAPLPTVTTMTTATATVTASATQQMGHHRVWLPWAYQPLPAR